MCSIGGAMELHNGPLEHLVRCLQAMNHLQRHRGPDGEGTWVHPRKHVGLGHRRLRIIDLEGGHQPMTDGHGNWITFNGEIYNYIELRQQLGLEWFRTTSDTEVILHAYRQWGEACVEHLRGMFAFALWDEQRQQLFCARDRFGIKPFYYTVVGDTLYFASETKALLPFLPAVETDLEGLKDYLTFQLCLEGKTLFRGIRELLPGHVLVAGSGKVDVRRYWEVYYDLDFDHTDKYFEEQLRQLLHDSVEVHMRSDVPVGAYLSGGLDSSCVTSLAAGMPNPGPFVAFTGKFAQQGRAFDESEYARLVARECGCELQEIDIGPDDLRDNIERVIYHLDYPVAGPGSFPQFMVSRLAAASRKVVLGGQGGDEIFGGYTRYLIAYFEQCIKGAIEGTMDSGKFIVTYESIIPNLRALKPYKPLLQYFWREGLFEPMDRRYFRLVNRADTLRDEVNWSLLGDYNPFDSFRRIFHGDNVGRESYFDLMTHFDFKTLLPGLLHVEDRMSMAHGLESRVPLLDHPLVELAATVPSNVKFKSGEMKHIFKRVARPFLPKAILQRQEKMGFPTPLTQWLRGPLRDWIRDVLGSQAAKNRELINNDRVLAAVAQEQTFGRKVWGLLCLELWHQQFHDRQATFRRLVHSAAPIDLSLPLQMDYKHTSRKAA